MESFRENVLNIQPNDGCLNLISWNVRGIKACVNRGGITHLIDRFHPDIVCLQEIQMQSAPAVNSLLRGYTSYDLAINVSNDSRYKSGTAIMSKSTLSITEPIYGFDILSGEGRVITQEHEAFYLLTAYAPALTSVDRIQYKFTWWEALVDYISMLQWHKPVILCGDLNATVDDRDVNVMYNTPGCTALEQNLMAQLIDVGLRDSFRVKHPLQRAYTWFTDSGRCHGLRLDYIFVSRDLVTLIKDAYVIQGIHTSDHLPVGIRFRTG